MKTILQLKLFVALLFSAYASGMPSPDACAVAFSECAFRFSGSNMLQAFPLGVADMPFTPQIVSRTPGERIGILNSNGVEPQFINSAGVATDITDFGNGFTPTQFKPFAIPERIGSGIGHETFQGNKALASGQCVRVFFTSFQKLVSFGPPVVTTNINLTPQEAVRMKICVVFRTT